MHSHCRSVLLFSFRIHKGLNSIPGNLNDRTFCHLYIYRFFFNSYDLSINPSGKHHLAADFKLRMHFAQGFPALSYIPSGNNSDLYTDSVRSINMDYSELVMDKQMGADSLTVSIGSSHGTVYVEANHLKVHAKAGSHITLRGTAQSLECQSKGHSYIDQSQFHQKK